MLKGKWMQSAVVVCLLFASGSLRAQPLGPPAVTYSHLEQRHPQAADMLQEVSLVGGELSLQEFREFIQTKFNLFVTLDEKSLEEEQIAVDQRRPMPEMKNITLHCAMYHYLDPLNCAVIEEPHRLVITTRTRMLDVRPLVIFSIQDLVSPEPKFDLQDFQDPIFDRQEAVRLRIETKFKKFVSWQFKNASIREVAAKLRKELDENVILDVERLKDFSIDPDAGLMSSDYQNVPLADVLRWVIDPSNLSYVIDHEAVTITTTTEAIGVRPLRVYAGQGLVFRDVDPNRSEVVALLPQWNGPGLGWLGGVEGDVGGLGVFEASTSTDSVFAIGGVSYRMRSTANPQAKSDKTNESTGGGRIPSVTATEEPGLVQDDAFSMLKEVTELIGGPPHSPWNEGNGGTLAMYYPSLSIVVKQTERAQAEIADHLQQKRALQIQRGTNSAMVALTAKDAVARPDKAVLSLIALLISTTGGPNSPWTESHGGGGSVVYDRARLALTVRQTPEALDEIAGLLVQLRRQRYALFHGAPPPLDGAEPPPRQPTSPPKAGK